MARGKHQARRGKTRSPRPEAAELAVGEGGAEPTPGEGKKRRRGQSKSPKPAMVAVAEEVVVQDEGEPSTGEAKKRKAAEAEAAGTPSEAKRRKVEDEGEVTELRNSETAEAEQAAAAPSNAKNCRVEDEGEVMEQQPGGKAEAKSEAEDFMGFAREGDAEGAALAGGATSPSSPAQPSTLPPWHAPRPPGAQPLVCLHNELLRFCDLVSLTAEERRVRQNVVDDLRQLTQSVWPGSRVLVYGSELTGLCLPSSDLDLAVLGATERAPECLRRLAKCLRQSGRVSNMEVIESAKVPIIKVVHVDGGVAADLSFNTVDGVTTGWLMRDLMVEFPPLRPLLLVLKHFLVQRELNETYPTGGVGSFLLQLMVVSFLQHRRLEDDLARSAGRASAPSDRNLGVLLLDFFDFFGRKFNYNALGISVRDGGSFFRKAHRRWEVPGRPQLLAMENPMDPSIDVGKNAFNIANVKRTFEHAYFTLVVALGHGTATDFPSILGTIMAVDGYLTDRALPPKDKRFSALLPPPPQPRDGDEDSAESGDERDSHMTLDGEEDAGEGEGDEVDGVGNEQAAAPKSGKQKKKKKKKNKKRKGDADQDRSKGKSESKSSSPEVRFIRTVN